MSSVVKTRTPIVVLDSGLGGLTVVRSLRRWLPAEDVVYFGDTARLPYGSKTPGVVTGFVTEIVRFLMPLEPKHVVVACNTATALALPELRAAFPGVSISGVIEPGAQAAVEAAGDETEPVIGIIATEATVRSQAYEKAIRRHRTEARVIPHAAPLLVPIIEDGRLESDPLTQLAVRQYLEPLIDRGIEVLVLGCTHYPILRGLIEREVGQRVRVVDSAEHCAQDVGRRLAAVGLLRSTEESGRVGGLRCWVTDDGPRFARLAARFLGHEVPKPTWVPPEELGTASAVDALRRAV
jgi:glutamate racemase